MLSDVLVFGAFFLASRVMRWGSADETPVLGYVIAIPVALVVIAVVELAANALTGTG